MTHLNKSIILCGKSCTAMSFTFGNGHLGQNERIIILIVDMMTNVKLSSCRKFAIDVFISSCLHISLNLVQFLHYHHYFHQSIHLTPIKTKRTVNKDRAESYKIMVTHIIIS